MVASPATTLHPAAFELICGSREPPAERCLINSAAAPGWLDALTIGSVVAAAGFGLLGLLTEYRDKEGRVTTAGRWAAVGVIATALLSILLNTLQGGVAAVEKRQAAVAEQARSRALTAGFKTQLNELGEVQNGLSGVLEQSRKVLDANTTVRERLAQSIARQDEQLAIANRLAKDTGKAARRSEENAARLMRAAFDAADRFASDDLLLRIQLRCDFHDRPVKFNGTEPPAAFEPLVGARLAMFEKVDLSPAARNRLTVPDRLPALSDGFSPGQPRPRWSATAERHAIISKPRLIEQPSRGKPSWTYEQVSEVSGFISEMTGNDTGLNRRSDLNDKVFSFAVVAPDSPFIGLFTDAERPNTRRGVFGTGVYPLGTNWLTGTRRSELVELGYNDDLLPCSIRLELVLNDQVLTSSDGQLAQTFTGSSYSLVVVTPPAEMWYRFPTYAPPRGRQLGTSSSSPNPLRRSPR